jgi:cell fate regulator YaaT (PSP1 superfamily)
MKIAQVKFAPWDKAYNFTVGDLNVKNGSYVIVNTELGDELGKVIFLMDREADREEQSGEERELKPIQRLATADDLRHLPRPEQKEEALAVCRSFIAKRDLAIKLIDVHFPFEGNRLNFAFIADGRVDFRELVKDLTGHFNAPIRLTQIGARDEARFDGDCGPCGRVLCCRGFVRDFFSVTSDMAETQQVVHRGSDRISGMCGRLMCCLSFEYEGYKELGEKLPPVGTKVNVDGRHGVIIGHHVLKQSVDVKFPGNKEGERDFILEVDINRHKKKAEAEAATVPRPSEAKQGSDPARPHHRGGRERHYRQRSDKNGVKK